MPAVAEPMVLLLAGWSSGISVYLTAALLGISGRAHWIEMPGGMEVLQNPFLIALAVALFGVEFIADKVPFVDSAWDSVHTIIRPLGATVMGYAAGSEHGPMVQMAYAMMTGTVALNMHAFKATSRLAINTSPEPFSNIAASTAENSSVFFMYWFFIKHPVWACLLMVAVLVLAFFMIRLLWRFAKKVFGAIFHVMKPAEVRAASQTQPVTVQPQEKT